MHEGELLQRIAETLKTTIGPAVADDYARTQAFMAAVILQKLGQARERAEEHARAQTDDLETLCLQLAGFAETAPLPSALGRAIAGLADARTPAALCALIDALYASREVLGAKTFDALLTPVRRCLRRDIDRRMEYAA